MSFLCPQSLLIFKDLKLRGFWLSQWKKDHSPGECTAQCKESQMRAVPKNGSRNDQLLSPGGVIGSPVPQKDQRE